MDYFLESNGSAGHVDFIASNFGGLKQWFRLYDYPRRLTAELIDKITEKAEKEGRDYEVIHDCFDTLPKGLILGDCGLLSMPSSKNGFTVGNLLDKGDYEDALSNAYDCFIKAKKIHDDWEQIYIQKTDFTLLNQLTQQVIDQLIGNQSSPKVGIQKDRFFGSATVDGARDYIETLTKPVKKRYFIKGRPGTGKSTFLKKIAEYALNQGFDVEIYHCSFDPKSLDMIILRELDLCLFDSTAPHEYFPVRETDEVIDIYQIAVKPGTDEENMEQIAAFSSAYQKEIGKATQYIRAAKYCLDKADEKLYSLLDPALIGKMEQEMMQAMFDQTK